MVHPLPWSRQPEIQRRLSGSGYSQWAYLFIGEHKEMCLQSIHFPLFAKVAMDVLDFLATGCKGHSL